MTYTSFDKSFFPPHRFLLQLPLLMAGFFQQLRLLLWKNALGVIRQPVGKKKTSIPLVYCESYSFNNYMRSMSDILNENNVMPN